MLIVQGIGERGHAVRARADIDVQAEPDLAAELDVHHEDDDLLERADDLRRHRDRDVRPDDPLGSAPGRGGRSPPGEHGPVRRALEKGASCVPGRGFRLRGK